MLYSADQKGPFKFPGVHDENDKRFIGILFRPNTWLPSTVYGKRSDDDYDVVLPTVFTGFYYKVINPGTSLLVEPTWSTVEGESTTQAGTSLIFEAVNYNLLPLSENVSSVTYICTDSVTVSSATSNANSCQFLIDPLPAAAIATGTFTITARVVKNNGEQMDVSLLFKVRE